MADFKLTAYEMETHFNCNMAEKDGTYSTYNKVWIRKLKNAMPDYPEIKLVVDRTDDDGYCEFVLPKKWVEPRLPRRYTEEQRAVFAERGRKLQEYMKQKSV